VDLNAQVGVWSAEDERARVVAERLVAVTILTMIVGFALAFVFGVGLGWMVASRPAPVPVAPPSVVVVRAL
jgi:ABC-type nitrate/sulfonate/bicarbonate transport system permease component